MKQQLSFDFALLRLKRKYLWALMTANIIYVIVASIFSFHINLVDMVIIVFITAININVVLRFICYNVSLSNANVSNFSLCKYFPIKRGKYYFSKFIISWMVIAIQFILSFGSYVISCAIHKVSMNHKYIILLSLAIIITVALYSSAALICLFSGRAFFISYVFIASMIGILFGGFSAILQDDTVVISNLIALCIICGTILLWCICALVGFYIGKKVNN